MYGVRSPLEKKLIIFDNLLAFMLSEYYITG